MLLKETIERFIHHPYPVWECNLTTLLVQDKWTKLAIDRQINPDNYSTATCIHRGGNPLPNVNNQPILSSDEKDGTVHLEDPSFEHLQTFYEEHGLVPLSEPEITSSFASAKIKSALDMIDQIPLANACVKKLVRSIHVLKQEDPEIDVSYSHPNVPFSVFVSVCPDNSQLSTLRVAESLLHETMHLKLTLIESLTPMVKPNAEGLYYSPWRDERRPAQGVLHGLFVFRTILDFYTTLVPLLLGACEIPYIQDRIGQITEELNLLRTFTGCEDLTIDGAILTANLLPSN